MTDQPKRKPGRPRREEPAKYAGFKIDEATLKRYRRIARRYDYESFSDFAREAIAHAAERLCKEEPAKCA